MKLLLENRAIFSKEPNALRATKGLILLYSLLYFVLFPSVFAKPLDVDLALHKIDIDHNFQGTSILLFGARNDVGRVVSVIYGPRENYTVRKKERVFGMWVNTQSMEFSNVPSFYSLATASPLEDIRRDSLLDRLEIGISHLDLRPVDRGLFTDEEVQYFRDALIRQKQAQGLYHMEIRELTFWGETLFRTMLEFPKTIERGWYHTDVYLFDDGELLSMQTMPLEVRKIGLEAFIYDLAHKQPKLYGVVAVLMAIVVGWFGTAVIKKFT